MKGFTITPILFVGLFFITGIVLLNFFDLDTKLTESINREGRLNNLYYDYIENKTQTESKLLLVSAEVSATVDNEIDLINGIHAIFPNAVITCYGGNDFTITYDYMFEKEDLDAKISRPIEISKTILCSFVKEINLNFNSNGCIVCPP